MKPNPDLYPMKSITAREAAEMFGKSPKDYVKEIARAFTLDEKYLTPVRIIEVPLDEGLKKQFIRCGTVD